MRMESLGTMFIVIIALFIICFVIGTIATVIDFIWGYDLDDVLIECTIVHMDIDDGAKLITVVSNDGNFTRVITVSTDTYAKYNVGDICIVIQRGNFYPTRGNVYRYVLN